MLIEDFYKKTVDETFIDYFKRVQKILPAWPEEVIKEWLFRENPFIDKYFYLGFDKLEFKLEEWGIEKILSQINSLGIESIDKMGAEFLNHPTETYLKKYIKENKTWPSPIIILENNKNIENCYGEILGTPYNLLEGNLRLGYIRFLIKNYPEKINKNHLVYVTRLK